MPHIQNVNNIFKSNRIKSLFGVVFGIPYSALYRKSLWTQRDWTIQKHGQTENA